MLDLVIRGGTVVDGSGGPARAADVAVRDGRVEAVGTVGEEAREEVDARGRLVTPGFVDPHTHYDAQIFWDPMLTPSSLHGVTSVVGGNCGFTLAPLAARHADYTRRMMAKVEGMPLAALESGVDWQWESFADYLGRLDGEIALNAGFLVGHCALRRHVMDERSVGEEAGPADLDAMRRLLHESLEAGGLGFSTTLSRTHSDGDGQPVPSRWASREEVLALAAVVAEHEGTTLEMVADGCLDGFDAHPDDAELLVEVSLAGRRPVNWNVLTVDARAPDRYRSQLAVGEEAARRGARVVALTMPTLVGMNMSFRNHCALFMLPGWDEVMSLPVPERMEKLADPAVRRRLNERAHSPEAGVFARLASWGRYMIGDTYSAANEGLTGEVVADLAEADNRGTFDTLLDIVLADDLRTVLWPLPPDDDLESWSLRARAWEQPTTLLGGSDAGAHLDRMCGAPYVTQFLGDTLRGRKLVSLERAVEMLTREPAELLGLRGRGEVRPGFHADLVVLDPETVDAGPVELRHDLPGGTARLWAPARGVERVLVNGTAVVADGEPTGATPGVVLRSGHQTATVRIPADA